MNSKLKKSESVKQFQEQVWDYYHASARDLPWRHSEPDGTFDGYKILVSEMMLQQTQVARVVVKYAEFLELFPTAQVLAAAPFNAVLILWSGLGYNRRAGYLHAAAIQLAGVKQPWSLSDLMAQKGVGPNTAAAVAAYAYNLPVSFIETNIRTCYIHHFFQHQAVVSDKAILARVTDTVDLENPREWYWALMDYGTHLKATVGNTARQSANYTKQSKFAGSKRELRGKVLRALHGGARSDAELAAEMPDERLELVLNDLVREGFLRCSDHVYRLA